MQHGNSQPLTHLLLTRAAAMHSCGAGRGVVARQSLLLQQVLHACCEHVPLPRECGVCGKTHCRPQTLTHTHTLSLAAIATAAAAAAAACCCSMGSHSCCMRTFCYCMRAFCCCCCRCVQLCCCCCYCVASSSAGGFGKCLAYAIPGTHRTG